MHIAEVPFYSPKLHPTGQSQVLIIYNSEPGSIMSMTYKQPVSMHGETTG